jgi:hypothetical protein
MSRGQTSSAVISNGSAVTTVGWVLNLIPKEQGTIVIPPVSIETSEGTLTTQEITVEVGSAGQASGSGQGQQGANPPNPFGNLLNPFAPPPGQIRQNHPDVSETARGASNIEITANVSQLRPYQNQSLVYTARVIVRTNLSDAKFDDFAMPDAIVQKQGEPEERDTMENGRPAKIVTLHYLITPLKSGRLVIPPTALQGLAMTAERDQFSDGFEDAFKALQQLDPNQVLGGFGKFNGFNSFKPFRAKSDPIVLDVLPPVTAMDPWLPLDSLDIKEERDTRQQARVGEPVSRKITLLAEGGVGSQLPKLAPAQNGGDFKVYADKPQTGESVDGKTGYIRGWRQEGFSLIPQHAGRLTLPEIRIPWWDLQHHKIAYAVLPAAEIDVAESNGTASSTPQGGGTSSPQVQPTSLPVAASAPLPGYVYALIGALAALLAVVAGWAWHMQGQMKRMAAKKQAKPAAAPAVAQTSSSDIDQVKNVEELTAFLRAHAERAWNCPKNASVEAIFATLPAARRANETVAADIAAVVTGVSGALYAGKPAEIEDLKARCRRILAAAAAKAEPSAPRNEKLPRLNPN